MKKILFISLAVVIIILLPAVMIRISYRSAPSFDAFIPSVYSHRVSFRSITAMKAYNGKVGLERMSPLGIVAASGLIAGTFLTMIIVPVVYVSIENIKRSIQRVIS